VISDGVTQIGGGAFSDCKSLKEIVIPNSVTQIGKWAFFGCTSLEEVVIPNGVTQIGDVTFSDCTSLEEIVIPNSVIQIGHECFKKCKNLKRVVLPLELAEIGHSAFSGCTSLTEIHVPSENVKIGFAAFSGCKGLSDEKGFVVINHALYEYVGTEKIVDVPETVESVNGPVFGYRDDVKVIRLPGTMKTIDLYDFMAVNQVEMYEKTRIKGIYLHGDEGNNRDICTLIVKSSEDNHIIWKLRLGLGGETEPKKKALWETVVDKGNGINIDAYDHCFPDLENVWNKLLMAIYRLQYPSGLSDEMKSVYKNYVKRNAIKGFFVLLKKR
jgi:hypothetical protein